MLDKLFNNSGYLIILVGGILAVLYFLNNNDAPDEVQPDEQEVENFTEHAENVVAGAEEEPAPVEQPPVQPASAPVAEQTTDVTGLVEEGGCSVGNAFDTIVNKADTGKIDFNKNNVSKYNVKDYLPKDNRDDWFDTDFQQVKTKLKDDSLINANRYVIGVNTVGQSLANPAYDLRGTIGVANPKENVGPWNNSTYEPDFNLKTFY